MDNSLQIIELTSPNDDLFLPWLDLYETSFPPSEKLLISSLIKMLNGKSDIPLGRLHLASVLDHEQGFVGLSMYSFYTEQSLAALWYLAISPDQRSRGLGSQVYQRLIEEATSAKVKAILFEVERPDLAHEPGEAERRIRFYQRNGAYLLLGIHYLQEIGWHHPPTPMHLMIHPLMSMDAATAFQCAQAIFQDAVNQTGDLALV